MSGQKPPRVLESRMKPRINGNSLYLCIDREFLKNKGIDVTDEETVPEEILTELHKGGRRDGEIVIHLEDDE
ncbi:hypothetical protein [Natrinema sp. DC36]|uniref:hypothetical protein n=1 Tax=Natrinema sp. DC36 TaxID=2878680 RepID=UPI001CEFB754|nr:hypothetical protein [Natrinema sp. DC36]